MISQKNWERFFALGTTSVFLFDFHPFVTRNPQGRENNCWPHFVDCNQILPYLDGLPQSYNLHIFFMLIFGVILATYGFIVLNKEKIYIPLIWVLTLTKLFIAYFWIFSGQHNFYFFHLLPTIAFLLNRNNRIFGAQVMWALCYSFSAIVKFDEGWIEGTYFSALKLGMPLFHDNLIPLMTLTVIIFEIFGGWALLYSKTRKAAVGVWTIFHVYSVTMVGFFYPVRCIVNLWILFLPNLNGNNNIEAFNSNTRLNKSAWAFIIFVICMQLVPHTFNENPKQTLRWEGYHFNMFDANYQCINEYSYGPETNRKKVSYSTTNSMYRCSPRKTFLKAQQQCKKDQNQHPVSLVFIKSMNGQPFYELVNEKNICDLEFSMWGENKWLNTKNTKIVGYPKKNEISGYSGNISVGMISATPVIEKLAVQKLIEPFTPYLRMLFFILWMGMLFLMLVVYLKKTKK